VPPDAAAPSPPPPPSLPGVDADPGAPDDRALVRWMFQFVRPVRSYAAMACIYLALGIAAEVFTTRQTGQAVDQIKNLHAVAGKGGVVVGGVSHFWRWIFSSDPQAVGLRQVVLTLWLLVLAMAVLRYLREVANSKFSMNMVYYIREAVYDQLQRVGFGFHDALSSGQLINRALSDLQNVRVFVQTALLVTLEILLVVGGYIALLLSRDPYVALLAMLPLPIWVIYILRFSKRVQPAAKAAMEAGDRNVAILTEAIAGVHVIKAFATEQQEIAKYNHNCVDFFQRTVHRIRLFANFRPFIDGVARGANIAMVLAVSMMVIYRRLGIGDFLVIQAAMQAILGRLQAVAQINDQYQSAIVSSRRLHEILMAPPTVAQPASARPLLAGPGRVQFENVSFGYDPAKPVLHGVNLDVRGGSIVAIVGPTGAGKTTLVTLIARFYDPQQGRILIDGVDLRNVSLDSLRKEVSLVFQETYLFSDTIEANIAYGRPHITGGEVEAAARLAQAHEFIETLPQGYQTVLRERGSSLSGGQRQRLAIARAILTNPRILILDDATAAVDAETEDLIRRGMKFAMYGRTTFVIAHRLSTVRAADLVVVMENGQVSQSGTHEQLLRMPGHYREIAAAQLYGDTEMTDEPPTGGDSPSFMKRAGSAAALIEAAERGENVTDAAMVAVREASARRRG
jgi:ATP-binding cassette subfamily B protein